MDISSRYVWMNGRMVDFDQATVPFVSAGLHHGVAVFEGIRSYATETGPAVFRLAEHVDRLVASARVLGFRELPFGAAQLAEAVRDTVRANELADCYIRPVIFLAEGGWNLSIDEGVVHTGIAVWPWRGLFDSPARRRGLRANVSSFTRHHPNVMMTKAKIAGSYVNSVLAKTESVRLGFDEAIMLDPNGHVAECTAENIFLVRHNTIYTPPGATVLEGITRDTILTLANGRRMPVVEQPITRDQLYIADEVFVSGTAAEVVAVCEIDHRVIGTGETGPVTRDLQAEFGAVTRGSHPLSSGWLTPVLDEPVTVEPGLMLPGERPEAVEIGYGHGV